MSDDSAVEAARRIVAFKPLGDDGLFNHIADRDAALVARALLSSRSQVERMREALEPFAKIADREELHERMVDGYFSMNIGVMNGNVTQRVIRGELTVANFRNARAALTKEE